MLCEMLCITDGDGPTVTSYARLTAHGDPARMFEALQELPAILAGGGADVPESSAPSRYADGEGRRFAAIALFGTHGAEKRLCSVLLMHLEHGAHAACERELQERIASHLLEHGDVSGVVVAEVATRSA